MLQEVPVDDPRSRPPHTGRRIGPRPRRPDVGDAARSRTRPRRLDFPAFAVVYSDRIIIRTPYDATLVEAIKQIPSQLRSFVRDGRQLERALREHLEANADYFASDDQLATTVERLVSCIAAAGGLSDSWAVALAAPELFEWSVAATMRSFPDLQLFDVRILE
jgi:hypothetical protein